MTKKYSTIALLGDGFINWGGGVDFLRFCANALSLVCSSSTSRIIILLPDPENRTIVAKARAMASPYKRMVIALLKGKAPVFWRHKPFTRKQLTDSFSNIDGGAEIVFYDQQEQIQTVVTRSGADVIIPSANSLGSSFIIPWVGYLHDFQHKYYPDFFTDEEIAQRDERFSQMLSEASAVIVNAADVKQDILKFYPETKCKIFNLPFSATPVESWFEPSPEDVSKKYNLPEKYFVMCNQFWIHKDHATAFRALALYTKEAGQQDVHIVCTGGMVDSRHPDYFSKLRIKVTQLGLADKIHFLGHIPKKDQVDIMKGSIAVLQPTLFEGGPGGGAVYDAIAMGVSAIISDIAVNREIEAEDSLLYFKAGDDVDMAGKMKEIISAKIHRPDSVELLRRGRQRTEFFGTMLLHAITSVTSSINGLKTK